MTIQAFAAPSLVMTKLLSVGSTTTGEVVVTGGRLAVEPEPEEESGLVGSCLLYTSRCV